MAQQQVVDIAALSRIGRATHEVREPNRSMDRFLEFAGTVAVNLFSKAFLAKIDARAKNADFIGEKITNLRDLTSKDPALNKLYTTDFNNIRIGLDDSKKDQIGLLGLGGGRKGDEARQLQNQLKLQTLNIQEDGENLLLNLNDYTDLFNNKSIIIDVNGKNTQVKGIESYTLPEDINFTQNFKDNKLNPFLVHDSNGKLALHEGIIDIVQHPTFDIDSEIVDGELLSLIGRKKNEKITPLDFLKEYHNQLSADPKSELRLSEDWPLAHKGNTANIGDEAFQSIISNSITRGNTGAWNDELHGSTLENSIRVGLKGLDARNIKSYLFGGVGFGDDISVTNTPIDTWIDNPTFDVTIDHDGDPKTPDAVFDGSDAYIKRRFGLQYNLENLDETQRGQYEVWRQGITNELKTTIDGTDGRVMDFITDQWREAAQTKQEKAWELSANNPKNQKGGKISEWEFKALKTQEASKAMLKTFETGEEHLYTIGEGANRKERKAVTDTKTNETIIYQRAADAEKGTYEWREIERKSSVDAYNEIYGGDVGVIAKPTDYKYIPSGTTQYEEENPIITHGGTKELRYDDFEKKGGEWRFKTGSKVVKQQDILDQLNKIE